MLDLERDSREKYNSSPAYDAATITHSLRATHSGYSQNLLSIKAGLLDQYSASKRLLDIGCADGRHLAEISEGLASGIGVDFSERFIESAKANYGHVDNLRFMVADARDIDVPSNTIDVAYSFATLYYVDNISQVYSEISRVLAESGIAILELGNARSLATQISRRPENRDLAQHSARTIEEHLNALKAANLEILIHKSFQILPMWGNLDGILSLLRRPALDRFMARTVNKRMIDEWISSMPFVRKFAFRHLVVCRKR
jgi:SAM-dependent methyltransferase